MRSTTLIIISTVVVLYLFVVLTTVESCKGKPGRFYLKYMVHPLLTFFVIFTARPKCSGGLDAGNNRKRKCNKSANGNMWHYNPATKNCTKFNYKGCAGNDNRWCTLPLCEACRRQVG
ncbi:hypothetical protein KR009_007807 [Drosophila setifemur]|nr:hypothetical protein KR009_007807 [Drosophila setifemur]